MLLPAAIRFALSNPFDKAADLIKTLLGEEYVVFQGYPFSPVVYECDPEPEEEWTVRDWPGGGIYDDWFESTFAGFLEAGVGATFIIAKSTGEPFTPRERLWLWASFVRNIDDLVSSEIGDDEALRRADLFDFGPRLVGLLARGLEDRDGYIAEVMTAVSELMRPDVLPFLKGVSKRLAKGPEANLVKALLATRARSGKAVAATLTEYISGLPENSNEFLRQVERALNAVLGPGKEVSHSG